MLSSEWKANYVESMTRVRGSLRECAERIPEGQEGFTAWPGAKSVGGLILHILNGTEHAAAAMWTHTPDLLDENPGPGSRAEIIAQLDHRTQKLVATVESLSKDALPERHQIFGKLMSVEEILLLVRDHELHHRGQIFTYLRLLGQAPPKLRF